MNEEEILKRKKKKTDDDTGEQELGEQLENALKYAQLLEQDINSLVSIIAKSYYCGVVVDDDLIIRLPDDVIFQIRKAISKLQKQEEAEEEEQ